jgi:endonuclease/exonuclease/phosphatase family metal-dependent hydrolase
VRVLTWNLFHGRARPAAHRELLGGFSGLLAAWRWDVALLQEVPPWWPAALAVACEAEQRTALTSRNALLPLRRALARRDPELLKSNGGGANAVLSRRPIAAARPLPLRLRPERRVAQIVRLGDGTVLANHHASTRVPLAEDELARLCAAALAEAAGRPLVLGGDLNLRRPRAAAPLVHVASRDVDHLFTAGLELASAPRLHAREVDLDGRALELSDHPPLEAELR